MPHTNEQLRTQDILFYTYTKTINSHRPCNALGVWKERKLTIPITIFIELIYMSSYIEYQSEITIIFPASNGKPITFDKGERKLVLPLCAGSS